MTNLMRMRWRQTCAVKSAAGEQRPGLMSHLGASCHFRLVRAPLASLQLNRAYSTCRRKVLKPPGAAGARRPVATRPKPLPGAGPSPPEAPLSPGARTALKAAKEAEAAELFEAPTLRRSTKQRVEEAEKVRQRMEQVMPHSTILSVI